ncbi:MAG: oxygenase MpaB family protein, partial [Dietzia cercidiphylli]
PYDARDPHLLRWVHVAEIWSFLECHRLYGRTAMSAERRDEYVRQASRTGIMLGAKGVPMTVAALDARHFLLNEPPVGWTDKPAYAMLREGAVAALPPWARRTLGLADGPLGSRAVALHLGRTGVSTLRWVLDAVEG